MWDLRQHELSPIPVVELVPVAASNNACTGYSNPAMSGPLPHTAAYWIPETIAVPYKKRFSDRSVCCAAITHLLKIDTLQVAGKVLLPALQIQYR